ncbi:MAG: amino acid ABC transporter permease [Actinobacteria bacterium]|nr:amino acid ABC transporter permease [Actinomycetota bacterium]
MKTERTGAGASRPPDVGGGRRAGLFERYELLSQRIPFRAKLALVWVTIFGIFGAGLAALGLDTPWIRHNFWFISRGLWVTVFIAACAIVLAFILALLGSLARLSKNPISYGVSGFYVSFFRGTPLIVQLFLIYLGLAQIGIQLDQPWRGILVMSPVVAGIVGLSLNYGAYMTEIFRAGIQSVPHGQAEAAEALGMTYGQRMRRVVLPQAIRVIIPPTGNEFIAMMKDTALVAFLAAPIAWSDLFRRGTLVGRADFRNLEALLIAAMWYWILTATFTVFQRKLEARVSKGYVRQTAGQAKQDRRRRLISGSPGGGPGGGAMMVEIPESDAPEESPDG